MKTIPKTISARTIMKTIPDRHLKSLLVFFLVMASVRDAMAVITVVSDSRSLNTSATLGPSPELPPTTDIDSAVFNGRGGDWNVSIESRVVNPLGSGGGVGRASQVSSVGDSSIQAVLQYSVDGPHSYAANTFNHFRVEFTTDALSTFNLEASTNFENREGNGYHQESLIRLSDVTDSSVIFEHAENRDNAITFRDPPLVLAQTGTLIPDHIYELDIEGLIDKPGFFEGTFFDTLKVTLNFPVPDNTGTGLLLAMSICALVVIYNCLTHTWGGTVKGAAYSNFKMRS